MPFTTPADAYWKVSDHGDAIYSSKRNIYVPASDPAAVAYGDVATVPNEAEIWEMVKPFKPEWLWNGETMSQPAEDQYTKDQLQNYNTKRRFETCDGGMVASGVPVRTDDRSRNFMQGARTMAEADPDFTTTWYGSDGQFYPIDAAKIIAITDAVGAHTNNCFTVYSQLSNDILTNSVTTLAQIDAAYEGL
jgi:Domain of unknown function (DUF4376)